MGVQNRYFFRLNDFILNLIILIFNFNRVECYCGNSFGKYDKLQTSRICVMNCPVKNFEICGGKNANSVWKIHA